MRCYNPRTDSYKYYGGRGITICNEWLLDFMNFYNWAIDNNYKEGLSIDRIDSDGNYEPSNCRWVTAKEQANNTRRNHYITYNQEIHTIKEWAEILSIDYNKLRYRIKKHSNLEKAVLEI